MRITAYVRPWSIGYFQYLLPRAFPGADVHFVSDFRGLGEFDVSERFHRYVKEGNARSHSPNWMTHTIECDIVARNFLLRAMPLQRALVLVRSMSRAIEEMMDAIAPDAFISATADSYVMDILIRHARERKIPYCGLLPCPFPGFTRVTAIGEYASFRNVHDEECNAGVKAIADPNFRTVDLKDWLAMYGSNFVHLKRPMREIPKRYIFPLLGKLRGDPLNYHYLGSTLSNVSLFSQAVFAHRYFERDWQMRLRQWTGKKIYLPMQAFPECTTDYHVRELDLIDFPRLLPRLLDLLKSDPDVLVCVKEHPGMIGVRPPGFYDMLRSFPNVVMIPASVPASALIAACNLVIVWTGTGGLEAAIRGKPVITFGRPYYLIGDSFRSIRTLDDFSEIARTVDHLANKTSPGTNSKELARYVLSGCFPGEFRFINFDPDNAELKHDADGMAEGIARHWPEWLAAPKLNVD